ncbi:MAG: DUF6782 family putative metallopeptidase, partial [Pseudomonadota bacterium]|nr:DUF6782 family putative metallopeptidase [Pseudomonadota bacterium]
MTLLLPENSDLYKAASHLAAFDQQNPDPQSRKKQERVLFTRLRKILREDAYGTWLLIQAQKRGIKFVIDEQTSALGYYNPDQKTIAVNPRLCQNDNDIMVGTIAHELVHNTQGKKNIGPSWLFAPRDNVAMLWAMEADADTGAAVFASRMKHKRPGIADGIRAMGRGATIDAIEKAVADDPDAIYNGTAARAAFDAWYTLTRLKDIYGQQIAGFLGSSVDKFIKHLQDSGQISKTGKICIEHRPMLRDWLEMLGDMPDLDGRKIRNYLRGTTKRNIDDAYYREGLSPFTEIQIQFVEMK